MNECVSEDDCVYDARSGKIKQGSQQQATTTNTSSGTKIAHTAELGRKRQIAKRARRVRSVLDDSLSSSSSGSGNSGISNGSSSSSSSRKQYQKRHKQSATLHVVATDSDSDAGSELVDQINTRGRQPVGCHTSSQQRDSVAGTISDTTADPTSHVDMEVDSPHRNSDEQPSQMPSSFDLSRFPSSRRPVSSIHGTPGAISPTTRKPQLTGAVADLHEAQPVLSTNPMNPASTAVGDQAIGAGDCYVLPNAQLGPCSSDTTDVCKEHTTAVDHANSFAASTRPDLLLEKMGGAPASQSAECAAHEKPQAQAMMCVSLC